MTVPLAKKVVTAKAGKHRAQSRPGKHRAPIGSGDSDQARANRPASDTADSGDGNAAQSPDTGKRTVPAVAGNAAGTVRGIVPTLPIRSTVSARRLLAAELFIGSGLILASPDARSSGSPYTDALRQEAYLLATFLILALLSMGGTQTANVAAALGGLIVLILALRATAKGVITAQPNAALSSDSTSDITQSPEQI